MAIEKTIEVNVKTQKAQQEIKALNKEIKNTEADLKEVESVADGFTGGAISKFKGLTGVISGVSKGFTTLRGAIIASGIGALAVVIGSVISAFSASEEGQNRFAKLMGVIGSVVGNVMDVISDLGENIIGVLSGDSKAIKSATNFGKRLFDVVGLPIKNIITIVETLSKTLGALFSGDIKGAFNELEKGVNGISNNFKDAGSAIKTATGNLKAFGEEALREARIAQQIADQRAKADKIERNLIVQRAEAERQRAELLEKAQQRDKFTQAERIGFLREASRIDEEITKKQIEQSKLRRDAIIAENGLSKSNKEALKAEEEAKAEVIRLEAERLKRQKEVTSQIQGLIEQEKATNKAAFEERKRIAEEEKALRIKLEQERVDFIEKIRKAEIVTEQQRREEEINEIKKQYQALIAEAQKYGRDTIGLKIAQQAKIDELENKYAEEAKQKELAKRKAIEDIIRVQTEESTLQKLEREQAEKSLELERLGASELEKQAFILNSDRLIAEERKRIADAELERERMLQEQKLALTSNFLGAVASVLGEQSKAGKAFAVAQALINTYQGISNVWAEKSEAGFVGAGLLQRIATTAIVATQGFATVKNIMKVNPMSASVATPSGASGAGGSANPPPQFNIVGGNVANQIGQVLGNQPPVQAFVVGSQVTSQQAMDRNIITNASLG